MKVTLTTVEKLHVALVAALALVVSDESSALHAASRYDSTKTATAHISEMQVGKGDWPQWGGWPGRNNTPAGENIPREWDIDKGTNIKWSAPLGSQTYGNPAVANGKLYVGTNNGAAYLKRYPDTVDLGCLLCLDAETGGFLWQHSSPKLPTGDVHDWGMVGICSTPYVDKDRLWFVTSRGEVRCLDTEGFRDGENDGPFKDEGNQNKDEADVIWVFDMMGRLGVSQHNMASCSVTCAGDILLVCTSNGVDESHIKIPAPDAPSFIALKRDDGTLLWSDKSPGANILHGQWSSPAYAVLGSQPQAVFAGGDGWLYSFDPQGDGRGKAKLLWKFDCNPKVSKWGMGGRGTRNSIIATPVIYDGLVYCVVGQDPEQGEGMGHLWCVDPTKRGDVSAELAVDGDGKPIPFRRLQAVDLASGEKAIPNPNSALVWHYGAKSEEEYDEQEFEQQMHRAIGGVAIKDDILYISDYAGLFHCLNARTGQRYWIHDLFAAVWGSPLIVDGKVFIGDEDGDVAIFQHGTTQKLIAEINVADTVYSTPVVANNVLLIVTRSRLFAIEARR